MAFTWYIVTHFLKSIPTLQQILHGALCYKNTRLLIAVLGRIPCLRASLRSDSFEDQVPAVFVLEELPEGSRIGGWIWVGWGSTRPPQMCGVFLRLSGARLHRQLCFLTISFLALFKRTLDIRNHGQTVSLPRKVKCHILLFQNKFSHIVLIVS